MIFRERLFHDLKSVVHMGKNLLTFSLTAEIMHSMINGKFEEADWKGHFTESISEKC